MEATHQYLIYPRSTGLNGTEFECPEEKKNENGSLGSSRAAILADKDAQLCRRDANYGARLRARIYLARLKISLD